MTLIKTSYNRRSFFKVTTAAGGGLILGFNWLASLPSAEAKAFAEDWSRINGFIQIDAQGNVIIMSPNPEIGQNVKTSMPMIVAEELDVAWENVTVKQAPLDTKNFKRQVAGGSQSLRKSWKTLRTAGATAREMLVRAAAKTWGVTPESCTTQKGIIKNAKGEQLSYGEVAAAASKLDAPSEVTLKDPKTFRLIGKDTRNVDLDKIITGKPLFGLDIQEKGMLYAVALRPPAFGQKLDAFDDTDTRNVQGVLEVLQFGDKIAVLANSTWAAIQGKRALKATWKIGTTPENSTTHDAALTEMLGKMTDSPKREDGDVQTAFENADQVIERTYEAPFLPHNCLEPMNFFAHVTEEKVFLAGPCQTPQGTSSAVARLLKRDISEVSMELTRMGGGFGRRLRGDFVLEAAEISSLVKKPVKLTYTREDDMTAGLYRPASKYRFKVALKNKEVIAYHLIGAGTSRSNFTRQHNFPACVFEDYRVDSHSLKSNITTAPWRAPITNFLASAEQTFLDEVAEILGQDPVQMRLDWFEKAKQNTVGRLTYDIDKFVGVIRLAAEKSNWGKAKEGVFQGFSAYYSHNTYVAEVAEVVISNDQPKVQRVVCAVDCGIVVNPIAAKNQVEGGVIDGLGHAMYGDLRFEEGKPLSNNFNTFRLIRMGEAPNVETYFVKSFNDPTGLGEPTLPPIGAAVANAMYAATGKRIYKFPMIQALPVLGG